ncbi:FHA domain-containing protein [Mitsuaria sp. TWR114]|uniref:FHA domain-containing protein n=1 Tax=Mitsuaria sp. TWR114 TaxID=2601731 RepID=UPI00385763C1
MDAVIEIVDRDGHCRETHKVRAWPLRIGRSPDCDLVLADPHLAGAHALLHWDDAGTDAAPAASGPVLELLPSHNGGWLDGDRIAAGSRAAWPSSALLRWRRSACSASSSSAVGPAPRPPSRT